MPPTTAAAGNGRCDGGTSISTRVPSCPPVLVFAAEQNAS